ncbi:MAG: asparaginase [Chloroflexales bacterium]|nr:asparaginase [Chloroflexales bacterium]
MHTRRRVYIAYTGGTIGMARQGDGSYAPARGYLEELMAALPELRDPRAPAYTVHEYPTLRDSATMTPREWTAIAEDIAASYEAYDGFVVLHGTDTMAYTASALAFMLRDLRKPIVLTGAQIPLCELRSDGRENLITALLIAAHEAIPEVCLSFGSRLLRGCRSVKVNASGLDAFASPNFPPLAQVGIGIEVDRHLVLPAPAADAPLQVQPIGDDVRIGALRLFPGISAAMLAAVLAPLQGLVLETYGSGNGPATDPAFVGALAEASAGGVVIVSCTQCLRGRVDLEAYATGTGLARAGVISGYDLTAEAALAKLYYLFAAGYSPEAVRDLMGQSLRGELTRPGTP